MSLIRQQVLINGRVGQHQTTGVQRYYHEIIDRLELPYTVRQASVPSGPVGHIWEQTSLAYENRRYPVTWSPIPPGPVLADPHVVTVHDLAPLDHPEWFNSVYTWWFRLTLPITVSRANEIITVSGTTKTRLQELYALPNEAVHCILPGVNRQMFSQQPAGATRSTRRKYGLEDCNIVMTVATVEPRKNLSRLFQAWEEVPATLKDGWRLVVVGAAGRSGVFRRVNLQVPDKAILLGRVSDEELIDLYSCCQVFAFVSLYEGFGLPILEAASCGCALVVSDVAPMSDLVPKGTLLVDPQDPEEMSESIGELLASDDMRTSLQADAVRTTEERSWRSTVTQLETVLGKYLNV